MKNFLVGSSIGIVIAVLLYFLWHQPVVKKAYDQGYKDAKLSQSVEYIPGKDSLVYRDTTVYIETPVYIDTTGVQTALDTTVVLGKDTLELSVKVTVDKTARWNLKIRYADYIPATDTIKIIQEVRVEVPVEVTTFSTKAIYCLGGIITGILAVLLVGGS